MAFTNVFYAHAVQHLAQATGGMADKYLGPATLLQAERWIAGF